MTDANQEPNAGSQSATRESDGDLEAFINAAFELSKAPSGAFRDRALDALNTLFRTPEEAPEHRAARYVALYASVAVPVFREYLNFLNRPATRPCGCGGAVSAAAPPAAPPEGVAPIDIASALGLGAEQVQAILNLLTPEQKERIAALGLTF